MAPASGQRWVFIKNRLRRRSCFGGLILEKTSHPQILLDRHAGENRLILQDVGDTGLSQFFTWWQSCHISLRAIFADQNAAGEDIVEAKNGVQDSRFSSPVRTNQTQGLLATQSQVDAMKHMHLTISGNQIIQSNIGFALYQSIQLLQTDLFGERVRNTGAIC